MKFISVGFVLFLGIKSPNLAYFIPRFGLILKPSNDANPAPGDSGFWYSSARRFIFDIKI